jgi:hypothetical protein
MPPYAIDEISKTNPHKVILWFQQHAILYSQRNVIIHVGPFIIFTVTVATLVCRPVCSLGNCSADPSVVYSLTYGEAPISNVCTFGAMCRR